VTRDLLILHLILSSIYVFIRMVESFVLDRLRDVVEDG